MEKSVEIEVLERVCYLIWTVYHDMLLTNFKKIKMNIGSPICGLCDNIFDIEVHVLHRCLKDIALWL